MTPPELRNADEPVPEDLPAFEQRLAAAMETAAKGKLPRQDQVRRLSWDALCRKLLEIFDHQEESSCW